MKMLTTWIWLMSVISVYGYKACKTRGDYYCQFPFYYKGKEYNICTQKASYYQPEAWCYLGLHSWDYCTSDCFECGVSNNVQNSCNRKIEGKEGASSNDAFPWHVQIKFKNSHKILCNGVIITNNRVLTTVNCVYEIRSKKIVDLYAGSGTRNSENGYQRGIIKNCNTHPDYNPKTHENDIAIINLENKLTWNDKVLPICYSKDYSLVEDNGKATFTGSRIVVNYDKSNNIHYSIVRKLPNSFDPDCQQKGSLCTTRNSVNKEHNDGGPLTICQSSKKCVLVGILSKVKDDRNALLLTNVSKYIDWIKKFI